MIRAAITTVIFFGMCLTAIADNGTAFPSGVQVVSCGPKEFKFISESYVNASELIDPHMRRHWVPSPSVGQGGGYEWTCIFFNQVHYLIVRGETTVHVSEREGRTYVANDLFQTDIEEFVHTGRFVNYLAILEDNKPKTARRKYPDVDRAYRHANFQKFDFEIPD
jgi:hypothetical protein